MDANNHSLHDTEDKWTAAPSSDLLPFSPYHFSQLENEKNTQLLLSQPLDGSPYFDPASPAPAYAPLHRTSVSHPHHQQQQQQQQPQQQLQQQQQQQPGVTNAFFPAGFVSTRPHPSDIETYDTRYAQYDQPRQHHHHSHTQRYPTSRSSADPSSSSRPRHQSPNHGHIQGQGRGRTKSKRHSAGSGESRARFSESSSRTRVSAHREGHDTLASTSPHVREGNSRSRTRHHHTQHQYYPHPPPSPPLPQLPATVTPSSTSPARRKGISSYFKNPVFSVFGNTESNSSENQESHRPIDHHRLSWEGQNRSNRKSQGSRTSSIHSQHKPHQSRRASQEYRQQYYQQRWTRTPKTGYPGRNGEEPETDPFQFLDIMMDMPRNPSWRQVVTKLCMALAILATSYFVLMALYFSAEFQKTSHLVNLNVLVVDLDHSMIGSNFLNFTQQDNLVGGQINWSVQSYKDLNSVIKDVENGNYWGAMVVQTNASLMLNRALSEPLTDYDPTKAFLFVYDGGRDPLTVKPYIVASMYTQFLQFTKYFNPAWIKFVLEYADENNATLTPLASAPQVLGTPVAFEEMDLHPLTATIITSATTVAYIWIFLVAGGSTYLVAHAVQPLTRHASVRKTMLLVLAPLLVFLATLSMTYSVLLRIFGVPFDSASQFMSVFGAMFLLQAAVASLVLFLIFLIPVVFIPSFTITFVVMNVIAVFNPVELMPRFFRWVYAMPFLNAVQMARFVLMGSYERLEYNLPILFAWIVVPVTLLPFAIARQKRLMTEVQELERHQYERELDTYHYRQRQYYQQYFQNQQDYYHSGEEKEDYAAKKSYETEDRDRPKSMRKRRTTQNEEAESEKEIEGESGSHHSGHSSSAEESDDRTRTDSDYEEESALSRDSASDECSQEDQPHQLPANLAPESSTHRRRHQPKMTSRQPLHLRSMSAGAQGLLLSAAAPSAPPEAQVFDSTGGSQVSTINNGTGSSSSSGLFREQAVTDRTFIEMPKLSRHPYASELAPLTRLKTPDEVK
ncbi:hypothetical protein CPC16_005119 [Podila verticillata]|nr:hypothetical protein CPC16_005119 [Podila verticillata]